MRNSDINRLKKLADFACIITIDWQGFFTEILILLFLNVVFQESERQKDQSIRKYEQEIDSLQFRNDQVRQVFFLISKHAFLFTYLFLPQLKDFQLKVNNMKLFIDNLALQKFMNCLRFK